MALFYLITSFANYIGQTAALSGLFIAVVVQRRTYLAIARFTAKQIVSLQVVEPVLAFVAKQ
jgi:hypothetical protein